MADLGDSTRDDLEATIAARRELGPSYEAALVDSFVARLDQTIAQQIDQRVDAQVDHRKNNATRTDKAGERQMILGFVSLGTGIPITAIAGGTTGISGILVAWLGIAAVNAAHALASRSPRD